MQVHCHCYGTSRPKLDDQEALFVRPLTNDQPWTKISVCRTGTTQYDSVGHGGERLNSCCQWRHKRWIILVAALFELFWFSGYNYGYNALIPIYMKLGVFAYQCGPTEPNCSAQEGMFHNAFIVWVVVQMCLVTGAGFLMDRVGLRVLKLIAVGVFFVGTLMFAFTSQNSSALFFVAGIFVSLSSVSSLICNHQISSMFPSSRGFVVSLLSGAFDSSGFVTFLIGKTVHLISLQNSFVILACCALVYGICMGLFALKQWSSEMNPEEGQKNVEGMEIAEKGDEIKPSHDRDAVDDRIQRHMEKRYNSFGRCIKSWPFLLVTLWFMFGLLRFCYFLTQMGQQMVFLFGTDKDTINDIVSVSSALLMCGFLISPISGVILDSSRAYFRRHMIRRLKDDDLSDAELYWISLRSIAPAFIVLAFAAAILSGLNFVKSKITYYIAFIFFVILRSLLFSASVNFVLIAFPIQRFGTVNGLINTIGGIFSLIQYGVIRMGAIPGNALITSLMVFLFISPLILFIKRH
ncbi:solute carrier family 43 member 3 [Clonorchis sinensis]|uniref:Solute carrier family 43 member 3 n=1 Tax=Clonorchis sinensis TaxID=79923 RepID=H2KVB4_CLOSI|nr:solute carrier family 43 member 3 [Clonorchis sinensis]